MIQCGKIDRCRYVLGDCITLQENIDWIVGIPSYMMLLIGPGEKYCIIVSILIPPLSQILRLFSHNLLCELSSSTKYTNFDAKPSRILH